MILKMIFKFCDLILACNDKLIKAHKAVMEAISSYLHFTFYTICNSVSVFQAQKG